MEQHSSSDIISRAVEVIAKEVGHNLAAYAELEEAAIRRNVGEDTVWGYVDKFGNKVDFNEDMKLRAAIAVLRLNLKHSYKISLGCISHREKSGM